jgi:hypothetical protein
VPRKSFSKKITAGGIWPGSCSLILTRREASLNLVEGNVSVVKPGAMPSKAPDSSRCGGRVVMDTTSLEMTCWLCYGDRHKQGFRRKTCHSTFSIPLKRWSLCFDPSASPGRGRLRMNGKSSTNSMLAAIHPELTTKPVVSLSDGVNGVFQRNHLS